MNLWDLLRALTDHAATIWRLLWLIFCFLVLCLFGPRALSWIVPYVLAGVQEDKTESILAGVKGNQLNDVGWFVTILPVLTWLALIGAVGYLLLH